MQSVILSQNMCSSFHAIWKIFSFQVYYKAFIKFYSNIDSNIDIFSIKLTCLMTKITINLKAKNYIEKPVKEND